jgi:serine/threonine protein kinase/Tfp pilus assembly protein PilF
VTEFIEGKTLREHLSAEESISLSAILKIAVQVAEALAAAHRAGIIHRDIKPENVIIRQDGYAKVLDFGLAKLTEAKKSDKISLEGETQAFMRTDPGMVMGTVSYMSPEQARGREIDARTDLWSLGVVLYEMLAGKVPFSGETINHTIVSILESEPLLLENVPDELQRIVRKALTKDQEMRYQTARDLLIDLTNLRRTLDIQGELERLIVPNREAKTESLRENATQIYAEKSVAETRGETEARAPQKVTTSSSLEYAVTQAKSHKFAAAMVGIILLGIISVVAYFGFFAKSKNKQIESIAVMPFVNESGNADIEYLSDGMTETLINSLSRLPGLSVKARSSVFRYKGKEPDPKKIASELNVQAVLIGRVIQRGDQITLNLELIDAQTENTIWGNKYERRSSELVSLQSEIARDVSGRLKSKLSGPDEEKVTKNYTTDAEANKLYLQGRFYANKRTANDTQRAIEYFGQAVALDPNYALAYAGLADAYSFLTFYGKTPANEAFPKARAAALKALALDSTLAEPHSTLGVILFLEDHDFAGFERHLKRSVELNPNSMDGHRREALRLLWLGKFEEARAELRLALEIEPLSAVANLGYAAGFLYEGNLDESEVLMKRTLELDYNFWLTHYFLSIVYRLKGNHALAAEELAKVQELTDEPEAARLIRESFAKSGWQGCLRTIADGGARGKLSPYIVATLYAEMGEKDKAFAALNETIEKRDQLIGFLKIDPLMNPLRSDPRFPELLKKVGFPE